MTASVTQFSREIEALASRFDEVAEETGAAGGPLIAAMTLVLAVWLDRAPPNVRNEIRDRVVNVLAGKPV